MYDFTHYIDSEYQTRDEQYTNIIFRKDYPKHVRRIGKCFRELHKDHQKWNLTIRKYKVPRKTIKLLIGLPLNKPLTTKVIHSHFVKTKI